MRQGTAAGRQITILAYGSRGDVQPYLALALGLARAGHDVRLAAPALFEPLAREYPSPGPGRVEFFALPGDPTRLMRSAASGSPLGMLLPASLRQGMTVAGFVAPLARQLIDSARAACQGSDLIVHTLLTTVIGHQLARECRARDLSALVFPVFSPTGSFPNPLFSPWPGWMRRFGRRAAAFGPRYHYLTHREFNRVFWHANRLAIGMMRLRHPELAPLREWPFEWPDKHLPAGLLPAGYPSALSQGGCPTQPTPILYGISRHALPSPTEWQQSCSLTGYWFLDAPSGWRPPDALQRFLDAGSPPVFIGFGSVISSEAGRLARAAVEALRRTGQRGVLLTGWGGLAAGGTNAGLPATIYALDEIPFDWLFPRLAAAVHHGGVNTTAAALRAGIPSLAAPFAFDQPFWGRQLYALGAGPAPIPPRRLNADRLADAIDQMLHDPAMRARAAGLGEAIRAEDGVGNAVRGMESALA